MPRSGRVCGGFAVLRVRGERALGRRGVQLRRLAGATGAAAGGVGGRAARAPAGRGALPGGRAARRLRALRRAGQGDVAQRDRDQGRAGRLPGDRDGAHRQRPARPRRRRQRLRGRGAGRARPRRWRPSRRRRATCGWWRPGAEERPYTGTPDHLGASALVRRLRRMGRLDDVRLALSLDEVGRGSRFDLHSTAPEPRADVEQRILDAGGGRVRWVRDPTGEGNSDHRELARAGAPAAKLGVVDEPCRHTACDTPDRLERGAFTRVLRSSGRCCAPGTVAHRRSVAMPPVRLVGDERRCARIARASTPPRRPHAIVPSRRRHRARRWSVVRRWLGRRARLRRSGSSRSIGRSTCPRIRC